MSKNKSTILWIVGAVLFVAAAVAAVIIFRTQIADFIESSESKAKEKVAACKKKYTKQECSDFADL